MLGLNKIQWASLVAQTRICLKCSRPGFDPWVGKIPRRRGCTNPVFLPGESHGQRSLENYSPRGHKETDTTERVTHRNTHDLILCTRMKLTSRMLNSMAIQSSTAYSARLKILALSLLGKLFKYNLGCKQFLTSSRLGTCRVGRSVFRNNNWTVILSA